MCTWQEIQNLMRKRINIAIMECQSVGISTQLRRAPPSNPHSHRLLITGIRPHLRFELAHLFKMLKRLLIFFSLSALALGEIKHFNCSSTAHDEIIKAHADMASGARIGSAAARAFLEARQNSPIAVDTYFHVLTTNANKDKYSNWQKMAQDQVGVMNKAYNSHGISFSLKGSELTVNDKWAVGAGGDMDAMKKALRKGSYRSLNIYFHSDLQGGILGVCTMPSSIGSNPTPATYQKDGCNVQAGTMPGGSTLGYNQGMTAVHETGHWMGLLHTFEGNSCSGDGDFIADTRAEKQQTDGCPIGKNTCPGVAGVDPIHNYMDYSIDACYEDFTAGQEARMKQLWAQFRDGK